MEAPHKKLFFFIKPDIVVIIIVTVIMQTFTTIVSYLMTGAFEAKLLSFTALKANLDFFVYDSILSNF